MKSLCEGIPPEEIVDLAQSLYEQGSRSISLTSLEPVIEVSGKIRIELASDQSVEKVDFSEKEDEIRFRRLLEKYRSDPTQETTVYGVFLSNGRFAKGISLSHLCSILHVPGFEYVMQDFAQPPIPYYLKFKVSLSPFPAINQKRIDRTYRNTCRLLNLVCKFGIEFVASESHITWVIPTKNAGRTSERGIEGFRLSVFHAPEQIESTEFYAEDFFVDDNSYFASSAALNSGDENHLPSISRTVFDLESALHGKPAQKFRNFLFWFYKATHSMCDIMLHIVSTFTALECLFESGLGPSKAIKNLFREYLEDSEEIEKYAGKLYDHRCSVIHGGVFERYDDDPNQEHSLEKSRYHWMVHNLFRKPGLLP